MKVFETKADLALATLTVSQVVRTKGATSAGDLGGRTYLIFPGTSTDPTSVTIQNNMYADLLYFPIETVVAGSGMTTTLVNGVLTINAIPVVAPSDWGSSLWEDVGAGETWTTSTELDYADAVTRRHVTTIVAGGITGHANENVEIDIVTDEGSGFNDLEMFVITDLGNSSAAYQLSPGSGGVDQGGGFFKYTATFNMAAVNGDVDEFTLFHNFGSWAFTVTDFRYV